MNDDHHILTSLGVSDATLISWKQETQVYTGILFGQVVMIKIHRRSPYFWREVLALKALQGKICSPELYDYFDEFFVSDYGVLVMEKLPGRTVSTIYDQIDHEGQLNLLFQTGELLSQVNSALSIQELQASQIWQYADLGITTFSAYDWRQVLVNKFDRWQKHLSQVSLSINFEAMIELVIAKLLEEDARDNLGLVHRDYGFRNLLYQEGQVVGVVDFEHAMLADPLLDLAKLLFNSIDMAEHQHVKAFLSGWEASGRYQVSESRLLLFIAIQAMGAIQWSIGQRKVEGDRNEAYLQQAICTFEYVYSKLLGGGRDD